MAKIFTKLNIGEVVYSSGGKCFKRLDTTNRVFAPTISFDGNTISIINNDNISVRYNVYINSELYDTTTFDVTSIDFSAYGLEAGEYLIYLTAIADGYEESKQSNKVMTAGGTEGLAYTTNGADAYSCAGIGTATDTDIVIANSYNGKPVTSIGYKAFQNCDSIISVVIPTNVTTIGWGAFEFCHSLTSVLTLNGVTTIGFQAFLGCDSLTSIEIPDSVTSISEGAFCQCSSLTSIEIPDSVTKINESAFYACTSLTSIVIPDSVTSIGDEAFRGCGSLTDVYYTGSEAEWNQISIGSYNGMLTDATIHYNYTSN